MSSEVQGYGGVICTGTQAHRHGRVRLVGVTEGLSDGRVNEKACTRIPSCAPSNSFTGSSAQSSPGVEHTSMVSVSALYTLRAVAVRRQEVSAKQPIAD